MLLTVFAQKRKTKAGKEFYNYVSRLEKKDGTYQSVRIRFGKDVEIPSEFPCNIEANKEDTSIQTRHYDKADGTQGTAYDLWVNKWTPSDVPFVDHSMDDFVD